MRNWLSVVLTGGMLVAALFLTAVPAQATLFTLDFWNETNLNNSTANVTVETSFNGTNTELHIIFHPGNFALSALGVDQFGYQAASNGTGPTGWGDFTSSGNQDGFGSFLRQSASPAGTDLDFTIVVAGNQLGVLDSNDDFAAHVRFSSPTSCSGFVGGHAVDTHSESGCTAVPEPTTLALLGSGLVSLGIAGRRKFMRGPTSA